MSQFSPLICKLESSNIVYICRISDCIVGLRLWVMVFIFLFFSPFFFLSLYNMLILKLFMSELSQEILKLDCSNFVYTWKMSSCIVGLRIRLLALILAFSVHFSIFKAKFVSQ